MGVLRTFARNILSNTAGNLVNVVVAFLLTPFIYHSLGKSVWGIWALIVALTGYYGILDLGIRSAVGQYVTRYFAQGDKEGVNQTINTALLLTGIAGLSLFLITLILVFLAPLVFDMDRNQINMIRIAILIMGAGISLSFPLAVFGSAMFARQRFDIANAVGISERVLTAFLTVWALDAGYGLVGLALVTTCVTLCAWSIRLVIAFFLLPGLTLAPRFITRNAARELWGFGIYTFLINAADRIVHYTDAIVIGACMASVIDSEYSQRAIAHYSAGANCIHYYLTLIAAVAWTLTPYATSCDAQGNLKALRRLWLTGSRLIVLVASLLGGGIIFLGSDFLSLWIEKDLVTGKEFISAAAIMAILALAALVRCAMTCGKQILFGMREVRFLAHLAIGEAITNLVLSLILVYHLGILGVALGTLIPITITQLWIQPLYLSRRLKVPLRIFLGQVPMGGLLVLASMLLFTFLLGDLIQVKGWWDFLLKGSMIAIPAACIGILFGTTKRDKEKVLIKLGWLRR